jgi:hypothetical protein
LPAARNAAAPAAAKNRAGALKSPGANAPAVNIGAITLPPMNPPKAPMTIETTAPRSSLKARYEQPTQPRMLPVNIHRTMSIERLQDWQLQRRG